MPRSANQKPAPARRAARKSAPARAADAKPRAKRAPKLATAAVAAASSDKQEKKLKRPKVVRDSFTMPENDYAKIAELKKTCVTGGASVKKSELLRAGLHALAALAPVDLLAAIGRLESVKTGRPAKDKEVKQKASKARKRR